MKPFVQIVISAIALVAGSPSPDAPALARDAPPRFERSEHHMGVPFRIVLYADSEPTANQAFRAAFGRIEALNRRLSDYDPHSELMQLCRTSGPGKPQPVSADLADVLTRAETVSRETDGAFDVTVGPYVRLWRRARRQKEMPDADRLKQARRLVGYELVKLNAQQSTVKLQRDGMRLDLGGIAKGYAVDAALAELKRCGVKSALVDGGGDIVVSAPPPGKTGWTLGIAALKTPDAPPREFVTLAHAAVATSGDAYQFVEIAGKRYSHIIDPRTGIALTTPSSVTVIAPTGTQADAWASALSVLEPCEGLCRLARQRGAAALIVRLQRGSPVEWRSRNFPETELKACRAEQPPE